MQSLSWRQAAHNAHLVFEKFKGSSKYFQAVAILRNKVTGVADSTLTSYSTPLNFEAIISRLDKTYADKRPVYLMEQELSTLRQGNKSVGEYYDEVQRVLCSLTNKTVMTYNASTAESFNCKYREDALRVFISGLKKNLSETIFAARPNDLPSALALAEELESNRERYAFASNFRSGGVDESKSGPPARRPLPDRQFPGRVFRPPPNNNDPPAEPMDIDRTESSKIRFNQNKRPLSGRERFSYRQRQRVNYLEEANDVIDEEEYKEHALENDVEEGFSDQLHFLEDGPCYRM